MRLWLTFTATAAILCCAGSPVWGQDIAPAVVSATLVDVHGQPRFVLAHRLPPGGARAWRYRTFDVSGIPAADRRSFQLSADGTGVRFISDDGARYLYVDLTRRERGNFGDDPEGTADETRPVDAEERAVREARLPGDPCEHREAGPPDVLNRRCVSRTFEAAPSLERDSPPWRSDAGWQTVGITPRPSLFLPALQMATAEEVFPGRLESLDDLKDPEIRRRLPGLKDDGKFDVLFQRYLRITRDDRRKGCVVHYRVHRYPAAWLIEYWFYFPFDYGGQGRHFHDSEHVFVELDVLGGWVRRLMGAGHGWLAGNNIYEATRPWAAPADLPLMVAVELGKHATAADIDRDFVFTPGIDENLYNERAKVWGVRDVIGDNNNHVIAYERTMSAPRRREDLLAGIAASADFASHPDLSDATCACQLEPLAELPSSLRSCPGNPKDTPSEACARREIQDNPDFRRADGIFKNWIFPPVAIRYGASLGPRNSLGAIGIGVAADMSHIRGLESRIKLPGRLAYELQYWFQDTDGTNDPESCVQECDQNRGWGHSLRYEQLLSNLFGFHMGLRFFHPDGGVSRRTSQIGQKRGTEFWYVIGPMVEFPASAIDRQLERFFLGGNVNLQAAIAVRQTSSPRYEVRIALALHRFRARSIGR